MRGKRAGACWKHDSLRLYRLNLVSHVRYEQTRASPYVLGRRLALPAVVARNVVESIGIATPLTFSTNYISAKPISGQKYAQKKSSVVSRRSSANQLRRMQLGTED
jgi:hypothetical protein